MLSVTLASLGVVLGTAYLMDRIISICHQTKEMADNYRKGDANDPGSSDSFDGGVGR